MLFAVNEPVVVVPLVACAPDHAPDAVHELALVLDQVRVVPAPPDTTVAGFAVNETVGDVACDDSGESTPLHPYVTTAVATNAAIRLNNDEFIIKMDSCKEPFDARA